jgi:hypothetical protein
VEPTDTAPVDIAPAVEPTDTASGDIAPAAVKTVAAPVAAERDIPVYRTSFPPAATLSYELRRGTLAGMGELHWKPDGERYEVRLEGRVAGLHVLTETSTGTVDANGLAPLRYTDWRARRGTVAANFQRDKGRITYSGPQAQFPLPPGAQDRVSWMLQIGAVLNAEPQHATPGGRIVMFVSGARADAGPWTFRYVATEEVAGPDGVIRAVKFTREPRQTHDRQVEVWLAPQHRHLPVRARFSTAANGEVFDLLLRDIRGH